jgi:hypothetical protein
LAEASEDKASHQYDPQSTAAVKGLPHRGLFAREFRPAPRVAGESRFERHRNTTEYRGIGREVLPGKFAIMRYVKSDRKRGAISRKALR